MVDLLHRVAPNTAIPTPISEYNIDLMCDLIAKAQAAKAPPPMDERTRAAASEYYQFQTQWNAVALEIKNAQPRLLRAKDSWQHKLLKDISADCFTVPGLFNLAVGEGPDFRKRPYTQVVD